MSARLRWHLLYINSWAPGRFECNFRYVVLRQIQRLMAEVKLSSLGLTGDESTLVQVKAFGRQVASHYLSQC